MQSIKFTTIVSLLLLGVYSQGIKPSSSQSHQLRGAPGIDIKHKLNDMPSASTLHSASTKPKGLKMPNKLIKAASTTRRSSDSEASEPESQPRPSEPRLDSEKFEGFASSSKLENNDPEKLKEEQSKFLSLTKLLNSESLPSQKLINEAHDEIAKNLKEDQAGIRKNIAALMILSQEQKLINQMNKIKLAAPLELSDMIRFSEIPSINSPAQMHSQALPLFIAPVPIIAGTPNMNSFKAPNDSMESMEEDSQNSEKIKASSISPPLAMPETSSERLDQENTVQLIEQDAEMETISADPNSQNTPSSMPPSAPAPDASGIPAPPSDPSSTPSTPSPAPPVPQSAPEPQSNPSQLSSQPPAPESQPQPQPQQQAQPAPSQSSPSQINPSPPITPSPADAKFNSMTLEGTDTQ